MKRKSLGIIMSIIGILATTVVFAGDVSVSESFSGKDLTQNVVVGDNNVKPAWGGVNEMVKSIHALSCMTLESETGYQWLNQGGVQRRCSSGYCSFECNVDLPSGALIYAIELDGCDFDDTYGVEWSLIADGRGNNNYTIIDSFDTGSAATEGCSVWQHELGQAHTVDNYNESYFVEIWWQVPGNDLTFSAIRIYYALQVSPAPATATFTDVSVGSFWHQYVEALAASGITTGYGDGTFRPDNYVTRGQMAAFLSRALGLYWPY